MLPARKMEIRSDMEKKPTNVIMEIPIDSLECRPKKCAVSFPPGEEITDVRYHLSADDLLKIDGFDVAQVSLFDLWEIPCVYRPHHKRLDLMPAFCNVSDLDKLDESREFTPEYYGVPDLPPIDENDRPAVKLMTIQYRIVELRDATLAELEPDED